ncbi:MAG: hypothetical protein ACD_40C00323G0007 [uncultured bacterium]|nr:MAG: hypothetical protein ACD_40C00323G0007 [uncultured bacterium]
MRSQPFITFSLSQGGVLSCTRELDQLPKVVEQIGGHGLLVGAPLTFQRLNQAYPDLLQFDRESGPATLRWQSIITPMRGRYPTPIRRSDIPWLDFLSQNLTSDEQKFLLFTLNCVTYLAGCDQFFGFAAYNQALLLQIGGKE